MLTNKPVWQQRAYYYRIPISLTILGGLLIFWPIWPSSIQERIEESSEETIVKEYDTFIIQDGVGYVGSYLDKDDNVLSFISAIDDNAKIDLELLEPTGNPVLGPKKEIPIKNYTLPFIANKTGIHLFKFNTMGSGKDLHVNVALTIKKVHIEYQERSLASQQELSNLIELSYIIGGILLGMALPIFFERFNNPHQYKS